MPWDRRLTVGECVAMNEQIIRITGISRIIGLSSDRSRILSQHSVYRWTACLLVSGGLAALAAPSALVIGILSIASPGDGSSILSTLSKALVAISFPLFIFAAHCMDRVALARGQSTELRK